MKVRPTVVALLFMFSMVTCVARLMLIQSPLTLRWHLQVHQLLCFKSQKFIRDGQNPHALHGFPAGNGQNTPLVENSLRRDWFANEPTR